MDTVQAGNELIGTFMHLWLIDIDKGDLKISDEQHWVDELKYYFSWDWLMPVIERINGICKERGNALSNKSHEQSHLSNKLDNPLHWKSWSYHSIHNISTEIDYEYKRVVNFITWYNEIKPQTP